MKLKSSWYRPDYNRKQPQGCLDSTPLVGNPTVNVTSYLKQGDRHMARQACLWAVWHAHRTGLLRPYQIDRMIECWVRPEGVRIQRKDDRRGRMALDITVSLPDWPDPETWPQHEESSL